MSVHLPAEILLQVLDYLPVPSLCRCASLSLAFRDAVYEDSRWLSRLRAMCVESNVAHQRRIVATGKKEHEFQKPYEPPEAGKLNDPVDQVLPDPHGGPLHIISSMGNEMNTELSAMTLNPLTIFDQVQWTRGAALKEFAKVWVVLAPLYEDLVQATAPATAIIFTKYRQPEEQARILDHLKRFGLSYSVDAASQKEVKLHAMISLFEEAAVREFRLALALDSEVLIRRYARVLTIVGARRRRDEMLYHNSSVFGLPLSDPSNCFGSVNSQELINLSPMKTSMDELYVEMISTKQLYDRVLDDHHDSWANLCFYLFNESLRTYVSKLIDFAQQQGTDAYLLAVPGAYNHILAFVLNFKDCDRTYNLLRSLTEEIFESHVPRYLDKELRHLQETTELKVKSWSRKIKDEADATESLLLSGVNREVAKRNFLHSFKKVILLPVMVSPFQKRGTDDDASNLESSEITSYVEGQPKFELPTTELAAQTAILSARLAGIKGTLSLEVAINLIQMGKRSIERVRLFLSFSNQIAVETHDHCEQLFVTMLDALGRKHVQGGFDLALQYLNAFNPRNNLEVSQVQPLVDFLELVHVSDMIQQMVEAFYKQELHDLIDRTDFLNMAVKEKKRFEQMIDDKVAVGLNRGIDVLIEQIDLILITSQKPTDYKPWLVLGNEDHLDLRPTPTAVGVVDCLSRHTDLLRGCADKGILDVFFQEVGIRFFGSLCKHLKRQTITVDGGMKLISDLNHYYSYIASLKQLSINPYFVALKELGNIFIIDGRDGKAVGQVAGDIARFGGVFTPEDIYEFTHRRADWFKVKKDVDRVIYGMKVTEDCTVM